MCVSIFFECFQCRVLDDRSVVVVEFVLIKQFMNFYFNEFKYFFVINEVNFVYEDNDVRYIYLVSEQDVFMSLWYWIVGSSYNKDCIVYLSSISNYIFYVVSVIWVVNVSVVMVFCLVFYVCCINGDIMFFFFWSSIDRVIVFFFSEICVG